MNIKNIDFSKNEYSINNLDINENLDINQGEILKGKIIEENDENLLVKFENIELNLPKSNINAKLNDEICFEVLENIDNKLNLKQIFNENNIKNEPQNEIFEKNFSETTLDDTISYKNFLNKNKDSKSKDNMFLMKELKESISHIPNADEQNIEEMLKNSLNPEKNPPFTMSSFISKSTGMDLDEKDEIDLTEKKETYVKSDLNMNGIDEEDMKSFEDALLKAKLPITDKNLEILKNTTDKFKQIEQLDENSIKNLLKKDNITLEDLYTAKHLKNIPLKEIDLNQISNLNEQIINILADEEINITEQNINLAKDFIKNEIEISKENFDKFNKLKNLQNNFENFNILEKTAKNIKLNKPTSEIEIFQNSNKNQLFKKYKNILEIIPNIKIENIQHILNNKIPVNLKNLTDNYHKIDENIEISKEAIKERLNLAKIQMKLTSEAIYRLADKEIEIDTKPLLNVINTLENLETEDYKTSLKIASAPVNNKNIAQMQKFYNAISEFYPKIVYSTFKEISNNEIDFSVKGISESIKTKNILKTFETFKTVPDARFGDNVYKLSHEFQNLLQENGFEITEANLKASKILTLNNMDFNEENLINVKLIDSKIGYVFDKLHPIIASDMIKNGFNPMERKIDELIEYIDNFSDEFGQTSREKIAEQILELDKSKTLSKQERDAVISIYRMLNLIEKDSSSSIGTLLKNEKNVTLGNLLESAKIFKKTKRKIDFDAVIDNETEIKEKLLKENNITNSIEKGIEYNKNLEYNKFILNQIINNSTPEKLLEYSKLENDISIETMYEQLKNEENTSEITKIDILNKARNIEKVGQDTFNNLFKNNIPATINNIYNMEALIKQNIKTSEYIEDFKQELNNRGIEFGESILKSDAKKQSLNDAINTISQLEQENNEVFDDIITLDDLDDIKYMILKNKDVSSRIRFLKDVNKAENGIYSLPLRLSNGKITDLNMLILNQNALNDKNINLFLQFNNNFNQNMQTYVKVSENGTFVNITTKDEDSLKKISNFENDIITILKKFDINPEKIKYSTEDEVSVFNQINTEKIANKLKNLESEFEITI